MEVKEKLTLIGLMLLLIVTGVVAMFNLAADISPALDTRFRGTTINIFWTIALRLVIAPAMIIVPIWVIWNIRDM